MEFENRIIFRKCAFFLRILYISILLLTPTFYKLLSSSSHSIYQKYNRVELYLHICILPLISTFHKCLLSSSQYIINTIEQNYISILPLISTFHTCIFSSYQYIRKTIEQNYISILLLISIFHTCLFRNSQYNRTQQSRTILLAFYRYPLSTRLFRKLYCRP